MAVGGLFIHRSVIFGWVFNEFEAPTKFRWGTVCEVIFMIN